MDSPELDNAQEDAAAERAAGDEPDELSDLRDSLEASAAASGTTLLDKDTEAFEVADDVAMAVSSGVSVESVDVKATDDHAVADVATQSDDSVSPAVQGMGMTWVVKASDSFIIKLAGKGEMESRYIKTRNDDYSGFDLMSMRRKGMGRGYEVTGTNWSVTGLYISSHVIDSDKQWVLDRWNSAPASDTKGNCGTLDISLGYGPLGFSFQDCDSSQIKYNVSDPGYYASYMTQGASFTGGARETGFHNIIKIATGRSVSYTHYQRLELARIFYPATTCSSWDADKTC